jgi:acetyl esterase/lipase
MKIAFWVLVMTVCLGPVTIAAAEPLVLPLWTHPAPTDTGGKEPATGRVTVYRPEKPNGAAMVICPGGGYGTLVVGPEGHNIAKWLNGHGITGLVLEYRLPKGRSTVPLFDAQRAIRIARFNAKDWQLDTKRVGIIGFSAGGHLASTAAVYYNDGAFDAADPIDRLRCRPDFAILIYPVVSMGEIAHAGSRTNLLGPKPDRGLIVEFSNEKQVTDDTPPTFLAHAVDDKVVVPDHSRLLYQALKEHAIPAEYLELPNGGHGLNGYKGPSWDAWQKRSLEWLAEQKFIPAADAKN